VTASFRGFDRDAMQFWHELASEMSKEWFTANKQRYQTVWVEPLMTLLREVARGLAPAYKPYKLAEPGVLRIHRDLRFSADKTPYKTHVAGVIRLAGARLAEAGNAVLYLHVGLDEEFAGVGCYQFDAARTARWRRAVVGPPGAALLRIMASLRRKGYDPGGYESYARVPQGLRARPPARRAAQMQGAHLPIPGNSHGSVAPARAGALVDRARQSDRAAGSLAAPISGIAAVSARAAADGQVEAQLPG
jgi:uncharacterized protein (TIGR02453 family)